MGMQFKLKALTSKRIKSMYSNVWLLTRLEMVSNILGELGKLITQESIRTTLTSLSRPVLVLL
jgi:hypothetical protein